MSVLKGDIDPYQFPYTTFAGPDYPCFLCATPLGEGLIVHWMGSHADIYFHPDCVPAFTQKLLQDWLAINYPEHPRHNMVYDQAEQGEFTRSLLIDSPFSTGGIESYPPQ
jgi:hypothetical protein